MVEGLAGKHAFIGQHVVGLFARGHIPARRFDPAGQDSDDGGGDLILNVKNIRELAVVAIGPDVLVGAPIDQLDDHPNAVSGFSDASLEQIVGAELAGDTAEVNGLTLVFERRVAGDDEKAAKTGKLREDFLRQPVGEELLLGIAAHIGQRQHGDCGLGTAHRL